MQKGAGTLQMTKEMNEKTEIEEEHIKITAIETFKPTVYPVKLKKLNKDIKSDPPCILFAKINSKNDYDRQGGMAARPCR